MRLGAQWLERHKLSSLIYPRDREMPWCSSVINPPTFKPMKLSWTPFLIAAACLPLAAGCASHRGAYAPLHATEPSLENQAGRGVVATVVFPLVPVTPNTVIRRDGCP